MMKTILLMMLLLLASILFAQLNYTLTGCTFNASGGIQSGTHYTSVSSFGEKVQGEINSTNYEGYLGFLFPYLDQRIPKITSIVDVPNDQGHQVQVIWDKCGYDDVYAIDTFYSLWRLDRSFTTLITPQSKIEQAKKFNRIKRQSTREEKLTASTDQNVFLTNPFTIVTEARKNPDKRYFWQTDRNIWAFVAEIPALNDDEYSYIASTLADSSNIDTNYSTFKVVYHDLYEYYESVPDSGYSVDNIPPDPTRTTIAKNGNYMKLKWNRVKYGTFEGNSYPEINGIWYKIYAGNVPEFVCDQSSYIATVTDLEYNFPLTGEAKKFYKVVVSDKP